MVLILNIFGSAQGIFNNGDGGAGLPELKGPPGPQVLPTHSHVTSSLAD